MSLINGDKAKANSRRRHRLALRERVRELRKLLQKGEPKRQAKESGGGKS